MCYSENMVGLHIFYFSLGLAIMWIASGLVVHGITKFSKDVRVSTFAASFLILGVLTSLTEISVGLNSVIEKRPTIFVGNLIGGSFVILMLIIPVLAIFTGGITLRHRLDQKKLLFFLLLLAAPAFLILDGFVSSYDAVLLILLYVVFFNLFQSEEKLLDHLKRGAQKKSSAALRDILGIIIGAVLIYAAGKILVDQTIFAAQLLDVPAMLISLLVLSLGTNMPELMIAARSLRAGHTEVAFGDYVGSAATNTLLFAVFTLMHGSFAIETKGFAPLFFVIIGGYITFFIFARIKNRISPLEGLSLILIYVIFTLFQISEILTLSAKV